MQEHNGTEPDFVEDGERFIVRLFSRISRISCRIGMSTDPWERIRFWKNNGYSKGRILARNLTYDQALRREREEVRNCGSHCKQESGGTRKLGSNYFVYRVDQ